MQGYSTPKERIKALLEGPSGSPVARIQEALKQAKTYSLEETGFVHPLTQAAVKFRDDGSIDLFVLGNTGIRIDPATSTINLFGMIKDHASAVRQWIAEDSITQVKQAWTVICEGPVTVKGRSVTVEAEKDVTVKSGQDLFLESFRHLSVKAAKEIAIEAGEKMAMKAGKDMSLKTEQNMTIESAQDTRVKAGGYIDLEA